MEHGVGAPYHMVSPHALDPRAQQGCRKAWVGRGRHRKAGAHLRIDVRDAKLFGNFGQFAGPLNLAALLKLSQDIVGGFQEGAQAAMVVTNGVSRSQTKKQYWYFTN